MNLKSGEQNRSKDDDKGNSPFFIGENKNGDQKRSIFIKPKANLPIYNPHYAGVSYNYYQVPPGVNLTQNTCNSFANAPKLTMENYASNNLLQPNYYAPLNYQNGQVSSYNTKYSQINARQRTFSSSSNISSKNEALKKTKLCDHWRRNGTCSYGDSCWYAHGEDDLRKTMASFTNEYEILSDIQYYNSNRGNSAIELGKSRRDEEKVSSSKHTHDTDETGPKSKRPTTNLKGLTVNIPSSITTMEPASTMPLSPAQERWISMSQGNSEKLSALYDRNDNDVSSSTSSSNTLTLGSSSTSTIVHENEQKNQERDIRMFQNDEFERKRQMELYYQKMQEVRKEEAQFAMENGLPFYNRTMRDKIRVANYGTLPPQQNAKMSKSATSTFAYSIDGMHNPPLGYFNRGHSNVRREQMMAPPPPQPPNFPTKIPSQQPPSSNLIEEIYRRQRIIEAGGHLETLSGPQQQVAFRKDHPAYIMKKNLMLRQQYGIDAFDKEHYQNRQMMLRQQALQQQNAHTRLGYQKTQHVQQQQQQQQDCNCSTRSKIIPFPYSNYHLQENPITSLTPPPKIFESLLPDDESFSIWLDIKPKIASAPPTINKESVSSSSLLSKMESLRVDASEMEGQLKRSGDELDHNQGMRMTCMSSPGFMSLYELLSTENLLEDEKPLPPPPSVSLHLKDEDSPMFKYDLLNFDTSRGSPSTPTSSLFGIDEKINGYGFEMRDNDKSIMQDFVGGNIYKKAHTQPSNIEKEKCYFFSSGGSCPFGDACALAHSVGDSGIGTL